MVHAAAQLPSPPNRKSSTKKGQINAAITIPETKVSISGAIGRQDIEVGPGYTTWNAGIGYALTDHIGLDLRYWDTAKDKFGDISEARVVGGVKFTF